MRASFPIRVTAAILAATAIAPAQDAKPAVEVSLELRKDDRWEAVDNATVFNAGDQIRFRFRSFFAGYLYVLDRTSSGESTWLYPRPGTGQSSRVEPGPEYLIPGTRGSFVIGGTPGFDITYWVVSQAPIETREPSLPPAGIQPNTLLPRCRESVLKARGLCVDERAGPRPLANPAAAPAELRGRAKLAARDLTFLSEGGPTRITAPDSRPGTIVYEFRIAHR
jgi:hypothetical protein